MAYHLNKLSATEYTSNIFIRQISNMSEQLKTLSIIAMQLGFLIIDWRIYARERERSRDCLIKAEHLKWRNSHYWLRKAEFLDQKQSNWLITILVYLPYDCSCANARVQILYKYLQYLLPRPAAVCFEIFKYNYRQKSSINRVAFRAIPQEI